MSMLSNSNLTKGKDMQKREEIHTSMLLQTISYLKDKGHTQIKADHVGYPYDKPMPISGLIPDITSVYNSVFYVTEAETEESIGIDDTISQWSAFSKFTNESGKKFVVNVPKSCLADAKESAIKNGIRVDEWLYDARY